MLSLTCMKPSLLSRQQADQCVSVTSRRLKLTSPNLLLTRRYTFSLQLLFAPLGPAVRSC